MDRKPKVDVIITAHAEGILAHASLCSFDVARCNASGADIRFILVLDRPSDDTVEVIRRCPVVRSTDLIVRVDHGDPGLSRNAGVRVSDADYVCILDADDLIGSQHFVRHLEIAEKIDERAILHPEMVVNFGLYNSFNWQIHQPGEYFNPYSLLMVNPWIVSSFSCRSTYEDVPYLPAFTKKTGFGYEDWHWNCETVAAGYIHELAWGCVYFYRRRYARNESVNCVNAIIEPSRLFEDIGLEKFRRGMEA